MVLRWFAAGIAFLVVAFLGIGVLGDFSEAAAANSWALTAAIALAVAFVAYGAVEYVQTRRLDSIARQFDTRTIALIPLAIAINIILGAAVTNALKIPIYLDSIGTILVGALAGPIPGALTGFLANILWQYVIPPPFQGTVAAPFAIVAAVIGLMAGLFGRYGMLRPRPDRPTGQLAAGALVALAIVVALGVYAYTRFYTGAFEFFNPENSNVVFAVLGWLIAAYAIGRGLFVAVAMRRMPRPQAEYLYRRVRLLVLVQGGAMALAGSIPLLNLFIPVIGTAAMVHVLDHAVTPRQPA